MILAADLGHQGRWQMPEVCNTVTALEAICTVKSTAPRKAQSRQRLNWETQTALGRIEDGHPDARARDNPGYTDLRDHENAKGMQGAPLNVITIHQ